MSEAWPRTPLSDRDLAALDTRRWKRHPRDTVVAIAEAWNAGLTTAKMATDLGCSPASLRMTIGALVQAGVALRPARQPVKPVEWAPQIRAPIVEAMAPERLARLRRVAAWDGAARRALDLYERGVRA